MTAKSRKHKTKKNKLNSVWVFLAIVIVLAIISMLFSYFWISEEKPDVLLLPSQEKVEKNKITPSETLTPAKEIQGTWVSNYDGAMLTITGLTFNLELSGIDESTIVKGTLAVEGNIVTFVYTSGTDVCNGPEGHYLYSIDENEELFFKLIKDTCTSRKERMTASWFKL